MHVRVERRLIADYLDLHPIRETDLAAQTSSSDRLIGRVTAGGVGQQEELLRIDEVEQRLFRAIKIYSAHGDRDHLRPRSVDSSPGLLPASVLSRTNDEAGLEFSPRNNQRIHADIVNGLTVVNA